MVQEASDILIRELKKLIAMPDTVKTHSTTRANAAHLAPTFLAGLELRFAGTRLGRQELRAEILDEAGLVDVQARTVAALRDDRGESQGRVVGVAVADCAGQLRVKRRRGLGDLGLGLPDALLRGLKVGVARVGQIDQLL